MARSLTVRHEETPSTNPLLTWFLVLAAAVLLLSALASVPTDGSAATEGPPPVIDNR